MGKELKAKSIGLRAKNSKPYALCPMPILAYHKVDSRRELGITSLSPRRFERQIRFLEHKGYKSISPPSIFDSGFPTFLQGYGGFSPFCDSRKSKIKNQKSKISKPVLITFDDGYEGVYTHAYPILRKYASTAIVFVTTGYIGKYNSWDASPGPRFKHLDRDHIREMADDGIWFGSHGVNHTFLTRQSDSAARYEIEVSKKKLEDELGRPIRFFSYPYGDYDDRIINFVREAGYEAAFSLRPELLRSEYSGSKNISSLARQPISPSAHEPINQNMHALPRIAIYLVDDMWAFKAKIGCVRNGLPSYMQKVKNRLINKCAYASVLVERSRYRDNSPYTWKRE